MILIFYCTTFTDTHQQYSTFSAVIEAKEGKEFIIRYRHVPMLQGSTTKILIYIDGIYARGFLRCQYVSPSSSKTCAVMGYPLKQTDTEMTCQSFTFGKMSTTSMYYQSIERVVRLISWMVAYYDAL